MKVTNGDILNSGVSLSMLSGMRLPVLVSLQVAKLTIKLKEPLAVIENVRNGQINQYGQQQGSGEVSVIVPNDPLGRPVSPGWEKFASEFNELITQEVEIDVGKIKLPQEVDGKPLQIEPSILIALEKFIEVE